MHELSQFVRQHKDLIVAQWLAGVWSLPSAQKLSLPALRNHVPQMLESFADALERGRADTAALMRVSTEHAEQRWDHGYDLGQVVAEYRVLRDVLLTLYAERGADANEAEPAGAVQGLRVLHQAIDYAIEDAVLSHMLERDQTRDVVLRVLGADLRPRLKAIAWNAQQLRVQARELDSAPTAKLGMRIESAVAEMDRVLGELLEFARVRLGAGFVLAPRRFDLRPLVSQMVEELAAAHPSRSIRCLARDAQGDFEGEWDEGRIAQAISNLVSSAVTRGDDRIVVEPRDVGEHVAIEIRSSAQVEQDALPRLYGSFARASSIDHGLGLYLADQIARAHGGSAELDSGGSVTTARVLLPRRAPPLSGS